MAGTNPYNPQTDYNNWYAWEQENTRQNKTAYENSVEGQKAKQEARMKTQSKGSGAKSDDYGGRGTTPAVGSENRDAAKRRFIVEARQKYPDDPSQWNNYVENQMTQWDRQNKTHLTRQEKDQDEQNTKDVVNQQTQEHFEALSGGQNVDTTSAMQGARESVEKLDTFAMPKTNKLGDGTPIDTSTPLWGEKKPETDKTAFPRSIWQAWKNDEFGPHEGKDAQQIRNNLILNSALTAIGNAARGFQGGLNQTAAEHKDSMWKKRQEENMQKQTERENVQRDVVMDTQTKEMLANRWSSYTPEQKQGMLDAYNAYTSGSLSKAEDLMRNSMGDKEYSEWLQYFENLKAQLSVNADARAQEQLRYMETMGPLGMIMGLAGKLIPGL